MILKYHGCGLVDLKNAEDWNNFFFTMRGQRRTEKTLIFSDDVSEVLETYSWWRLCTSFRNSRKRCHFPWVWA